MAGAVPPDKYFRFDLDFKASYTTSAGKTLPFSAKEYAKLLNCLQTDIRVIQGYIPSVVSFTNVPGKKEKLKAAFCISKDESSLRTFFNDAKKSNKHHDNEIEKQFRNYFEKNELIQRVGISGFPTWDVTIYMDEGVFQNNLQQVVRSDQSGTVKSTEHGGMGSGFSQSHTVVTGDPLRTDYRQEERPNAKSTCLSTGSHQMSTYSANPGQQVIEKKFIVSIHSTSKMTLSSVTIRFKDTNIGAREMYADDTEVNAIYSVNMQVPINTLLQYKYVAKGKYIGYLYNSKFLEESPVYTVDNSSTVQRDKMVLKYCIEKTTYQLLDIFNSSGTSLDKGINDIITDIHTLLSSIRMRPDEVEKILSSLFEELEKTEFHRALMFIPFVVACLLTHIRDIRNLLCLTSKRSGDVLRQLRGIEWRITNKTLRKDVAKVVFDMSKIHLYGKFCFLSFADLCFPFLDAELIHDVLKTEMDSGHFRIVNGESSEMQELAKRVCYNVYAHNCNDGMDSKHSLLLKDIIYSLNGRLGHSVIKCLKDHATIPHARKLLEDISDIVRNALLAEIAHMKLDGHIEDLLTLWHDVDSQNCVHYKVVADIEEAVLYAVGKQMPYTQGFENALCLFMEDEILFTKKAVQRKLMESIANSKVFDCAFLNFVGLEKFKHLCTVEEQDMFIAWLKKDVNLCKGQRSCEIPYYYKALGELCSIQQISEQANLKDVLETEVLKKLMGSKLEDAMEGVRRVDKFIGTWKSFPEEMFCRHINKFIKQKMTTDNRPRWLQSLCEKGVLRIHSRIIVQVVDMLLDDISSEPTDCVASFKQMNQWAKLWHTILTAEGPAVKLLHSSTFYQTAVVCLDSLLKRLREYDMPFHLLDAFNGQRQTDAINLLELRNKSSELKVADYWDQMKRTFTKQQTQLKEIDEVLTDIIEFMSDTASPIYLNTLQKDIRIYEENLKNTFTVNDIRKDCGEHRLVEELHLNCKKIECVVKSKVFWNVGVLQIVEQQKQMLEAKEPEKHTPSEGGYCHDPVNDQDIQSLKDGGQKEQSDSTESKDNTMSKDKEREEKDQSKLEKEDETTSIPGESKDGFMQTHEDNEIKEDNGSNKSTSLDEIPLHVKQSIVFFDILLNTGYKLYHDEWEGFNKDPKFSFARCVAMFAGSINSEEIAIAENCLKMKIPPATITTLDRVVNLKKMKEKVEIFKKSLEALNIDLAKDSKFRVAVKSFEDLLNDARADYTFNHVRDSLGLIYEISDPLSMDTIEILRAISESTGLVEFLKSIIDDDIRTLIDAVEDISEQHVQETTVSSLIETKRFLQPFIGACIETTAQTIFNEIDMQTKEEKSARNIPTKIHDCMDNLHNLKSLYNNVANRSEQTKEIIQNVVSDGKFHFDLDKDTLVCSFQASYVFKERQSLHATPVLLDLRSRALLLMNKYEQESQAGDINNELQTFIALIDQCSEISDLIHCLHASGNIKYKLYKTVVNTGDINKLKETLQMEYDDWDHHVETMKEKYYLLNFLQGPQIFTLHTFVESTNLISDHSDATDDVDIFLKFIHPEIRATHIKKIIIAEKPSAEFDAFGFLSFIGDILKQCVKDLPLFERPFRDMSETKTKISDVVQAGRLYVAHLDEQSLLVVKTVLTLFYNTLNRFPEPSQVLFCSMDTNWTDIDALIRRCLGSCSFYCKPVLFCIANVEALPNELQFRLVGILQNLDKKSGYRLAVVCRGSKNHPFVDELSESVHKIRPLSDKVIEDLLCNECPDVRAITSEVAGLGKTADIYKNAHRSSRSVETLHISGNYGKDSSVYRLKKLRLLETDMLHIDVGALGNPLEFDTFLFELIVLRYTTSGRNSLYLPTSYTEIEIANSLQDSLRNSLQTAVSFKRVHLQWNDYDDFVVSKELHSPVQAVCHFLYELDKCTLDATDIHFSGTKPVKPLSTAACRLLLKKYLPSTKRMSFCLVSIFLNVLGDQLKKMACSTFFGTSRLKDMVGHKSKVRSELVTALIDVSKEFASRSVDSYRDTQLSTVGLKSDGVIKRVEGMIRWEDSNHLMYVFHNQNVQTISPIYRHVEKVPGHVKSLFESQMKKELQDYRKMSDSELMTILQKVSRSNPLMLEDSKLKLLAIDYALTPDNLLKMILIILRIKAGIPVLIMGETGCGKTSLIRYLAAICECIFDVLNIHAGVEEKTVIDKLSSCDTAASTNLEKEHWLFFDEINTSEYVGLISDMICHRTLCGHQLSPNLVLMGACNPYKLRSASAVETAGLKGKVSTDEMSRLVYRVLPLPEMMVDYVWDFGSLSIDDERIYIKNMTKSVFPGNEKLHQLFTELLSGSQEFIRKIEETSCSVSLRDVRRCKILAVWFLDILKLKEDTRNPTPGPGKVQDTRETAVILSLAHCYHSRLAKASDRERYRQTMSNAFKGHGFNLTADMIRDVIKQEQDDILNRMQLPPGTAKNTALRENVFVLLVCILNRIPIFVVGKPGCSKSLSMQVIRSNLRGGDSKDVLFKKLPQLYCVSFQGSESSTSDGIIKVFEKAEKYQKSNLVDNVLSVVILDEIGLAEISRFNPLKVLHNLLEPDGQERPNVAVVGISNWSLDASKMNRAIHLSRPDMDVNELYETGISICNSLITTESETGVLLKILDTKINRPKLKTDDLKEDLINIAKSYHDYSTKQAFKNFHGLRDYYSLVKYFAKEMSKTAVPSEDEKRLHILKGLERNFGGLPSDSERRVMFSIFNFKDVKCLSPVTEIIKGNIEDENARHLLLIATGESVIDVLDQILESSGREKKEVIFGSQFDEDLTDDYNYRILNRILICMEQGIVLILKDLETIYGSLYDMLNQNYTVIGKKKNCRVALGPYSNPICHVADSFRCIVIVDDGKLEFSDPPFLNRFEKQHLCFADILSDEQNFIILEIETWLQGLCSVDDRFNENDAFPIYGNDMVASVVLQQSRNINKLDTNNIREGCKRALLWIIKPEAVIRFRQSLIETDDWEEAYFSLPIHDGITGLLDYHLPNKDLEVENQMTVVFTNSKIHTKILHELGHRSIQVEKLGYFKSEKQLSSRMRRFWLESESNILMLQCSAVEDGKHLMLAKSVIERYREEFISETISELKKHVYLIIHLDTTKGNSKVLSQINFLSNWKLVTLDSLERPTIPLPSICSKTLYEALEAKRPLNAIIQEQMFWAFTRIRYSVRGRTVESIANVMRQIQNSDEFQNVIEELVCNWLKENCKDIDDAEWQLNVACDKTALRISPCFSEALDSYIFKTICGPLAEYISKMENESVLDAFFVADSSSVARQNCWKKIIFEDRQLDIGKIREDPGPESFTCNSFGIELKMPFSKYIFEQVENIRDEFLYYVKLLKERLELEQDEHLPNEVLHDLKNKQEQTIYQRVPILLQIKYESSSKDYIHDFCNIVSFSICPGLGVDKRILFTQWILSKFYRQLGFPKSNTDLIKGTVCLHVCFWTHSDLFCSQIKLLELCAEHLTKDDMEKLGIWSDETSEGQIEWNINSQENPPESKQQADGNICKMQTAEENISNDFNLYSKEKEMERTMSAPKESKDNESDTVDQPADNLVSNVESSAQDIVSDNETLATAGVAPCLTTLDYQQNTTGVHATESNTLMDESASTIRCVASSSQCSDVNQSTQDDTIINDIAKPAFSGDEIESDGISEESDSTESNDKDNILVKIVSRKSLPTQTTIRSYGSLKAWDVYANSVLALLRRVDSDSRYVHYLRICSDICSSLILPFSIDCNLLECFAENIMKTDDLESDGVYNALCDIITQDVPETSTVKQGVIANYFLRCLLIESNTDVLSRLIDLVCNDKLPDDNVAVFKPVLKYAFNIEMEEENILLQILNDSFASMPETCAVDTMESHEGRENKSRFITDLDLMLKQCFGNKNAHCPFLILLIDLFEDSFFSYITTEDSEEDKQHEFQEGFLSMLVNSKRILENGGFGLQFSLACGFFKAGIRYLVEQIDNLDKKQMEYFNAMLEVKTDTPNAVGNYVWKMMAGDMLPSLFKKHLDGLKDDLQNTANSHFLDKFVDYSVDRCPLLNFLKLHVDYKLDSTEPLTEDLLGTMFDSSSTETVGKECGLYLLAYAERTFYIPRSYTALDDKTKSLAESIFELSQKLQLHEDVKHLLHFLLGKKDFEVEHHMHSEQSPPLDIHLNTFFISLYALSVTHRKSCDVVSFFQKCLRNPSDIGSCYIPGHPESELDATHLIGDMSFTNCSCHYRLATKGRGDETSTCPVCSKEIQTWLSPDYTTETTSWGPGFHSTETMLSARYSTRNLSTVSCQLLFLTIKGCFLGYVGLGLGLPGQLEKIFQVPVIDNLWKEVELHWNNIGTILGVGQRAVGHFLHTFLLSAKDTLFFNCPEMKTADERLKWEDEFETVVQDVFKHRFTYVCKMIKDNHVISGIKCLSLEDMILEVDDSSDNHLTTCFRIKHEPHVDNFIDELFRKRRNFPFLYLVLTREQDLKLPQVVINIMKWHSAVISVANYAVRKHECLSLTVSDFIKEFGSSKNKILQKRFDELKSSWSHLNKVLKHHPLLDGKSNLNSNMKMECCMIHSIDSILYRVLEFLVQKQNMFLDNVLSMAHNCGALTLFTRPKSVSVFPYVHISDVARADLMEHDPSIWPDLLDTRGNSYTTYGQGHMIWYDFTSIERFLADKLLIGKAFVILESLPEIVFTDEIYKNYVVLSKNIKEKVKQTKLVSSVKGILAEKQKDDPKACKELMTHVGMVITLLNKTGGDPEKCLVDYIHEMKNMLTKPFDGDLLPSPATAIKLGHIIALYDVLEEVNANPIIEALEEDYRQDLDMDQESYFTKLVEDDIEQGNLILIACKKFVSRCLSVREADASRPLLEYLSDLSFWPENMNLARVTMIIPIEVMVNNIHCLVTLIETEVQKQELERMELTKYTISYKETRQKTSKKDEDKQKRKKNKKKTMKTIL